MNNGLQQNIYGDRINNALDVRTYKMLTVQEDMYIIAICNRRLTGKETRMIAYKWEGWVK